jgi:hypothetical protein
MRLSPGSCPQGAGGRPLPQGLQEGSAAFGGHAGPSFRSELWHYFVGSWRRGAAVAYVCVNFATSSRNIAGFTRMSKRMAYFPEMRRRRATSWETQRRP